MKKMIFLKEIYKNINYLKLTPELIGKKIFDEEFFKKIDAIEKIQF